MYTVQNFACIIACGSRTQGSVYTEGTYLQIFWQLEWKAMIQRKIHATKRTISSGFLKYSNLQIVLLCSILNQNIGYNYLVKDTACAGWKGLHISLDRTKAIFIFLKVIDTPLLLTLEPHSDSPAKNSAFSPTEC